MSAPRRSALRRLLVALLLVLLAGCGGERVVAVREWRVDSRVITLPAKIDVPASTETFVLRADVGIDPDWRGRTLTFVIPQVEARTTLLLAGRVLEPLDEPATGFRGDRAPRWRIPGELTGGAKLPLTLVVSNSAPQSTRWSTTPRLSATSYGDARFRWTKSINLVSSAIALGALAFMFVTYAALYLLDRRKRAFGFLAVAAALSTSSPLLWLDATQRIFGSSSWCSSRCCSRSRGSRCSSRCTRTSRCRGRRSGGGSLRARWWSCASVR